MQTKRQLADELNVTVHCIFHRARNLGIQARIVKGKAFFNEHEKRLISNYPKNYKKKRILPEMHFAVLHNFYGSKNNSYSDIQKATGISIHTVMYILNEFFKNDMAIVLELKLNYE